MSFQIFLKLSITSWYEWVGGQNDEGGPSGPPSLRAAIRLWFLAIAPLCEGTDEARRVPDQPGRAEARPRLAGHGSFGIG